MANSFHVGSAIAAMTDLSGVTYDLTVGRVKFPWFAAPRISEIDMPQIDGVYLDCNYLGGATLTITCHIIGTNAADTLANLDAVLGKIDPRLGAQYIKLDALSTRVFHGMLAKEINEEWRGEHALIFDAVFRLGRAFSQSTSATSQTVSSPASFNVPATGAVAGNVDLRPTITVKAHTGGALTITNVTTGEKVSTNTDMAAGTWWKFDSDRKVIEVSTDGGTTWSANQAVLGTYANFPSLTAGVANAFTITGGTGGTVAVDYSARYG